MKKCRKCGETKLTSAFGRRKHGKNGLRAQCKDCYNKSRAKYRDPVYQARYYNEHKEQIAKRSTEYRANHPGIHAKEVAEYRKTERGRIVCRTASHRYRARKSRSGGTHTVDDVLRQGNSQDWKCWWCGSDCRDRYHEDHLIPVSKGGHNNPNNIVISCPTCNLRKRNLLPDEFSGRLL